jgi:hypothetical protein
MVPWQWPPKVRTSKFKQAPGQIPAFQTRESRFLSARDSSLGVASGTFLAGTTRPDETRTMGKTSTITQQTTHRTKEYQ